MSLCNSVIIGLVKSLGVFVTLCRYLNNAINCINAINWTIHSRKCISKCYWQIWVNNISYPSVLTHWDRVTHICVDNLTIIGSDNGLAPARRQAIIWTRAGILSIANLGTNFSEILIEIHTFLSRKMHLKILPAKWWTFCLGLNVLIVDITARPANQITYTCRRFPFSCWYLSAGYLMTLMLSSNDPVVRQMVVLHPKQVNTSTPGRSSRHFAAENFKCIARHNFYFNSDFN